MIKLRNPFRRRFRPLSEDDQAHIYWASQLPVAETELFVKTADGVIRWKSTGERVLTQEEENTLVAIAEEQGYVTRCERKPQRLHWPGGIW